MSVPKLLQGWFIKAHLPECFLFVPVCISLPTYCTCGVACPEGRPRAVNLLRGTAAVHKASLMLYPSKDERSKERLLPLCTSCPAQAPDKSHCKVTEKLTCLPGLVPFKYSSLCQIFFVNVVKLSGFTGEIQEQPSQVENPREHLGQNACVCCWALEAQGWEETEGTAELLMHSVFIKFPSYSFLQ